MSKRRVETIIEKIELINEVVKMFDSSITKALKNWDILVRYVYDIGLINDETYSNLIKAIGFRNSMIHDYMKFDDDILKNIIKERFYMHIYNFLIQEPNYTKVQLSRIEN